MYKNISILVLISIFISGCSCFKIGSAESKWFYTPSSSAVTWEKVEATSKDEGKAVAVGKNTIMPRGKAPKGQGLARVKYDVGSLNNNAMVVLLDLEGIENNPSLLGMLITGNTALLGKTLTDDEKLRNEVILWGRACSKTRCSGEDDFYVPTNNDKGYLPFVFGDIYSIGSMTITTDDICDSKDLKCLSN